MRRLLVAAAAVVLALSACGGDDEREASMSPTPTPAGETRLVVVVRPRGPGGRVRRRVVDCSGTVRGADQAGCDRLASVRFEAFAPVPADAVCTEIYGGPATARVTGTLRGREIDASFSRVNGCEIARWDELEWLLGTVPGVLPPP